VKSTLRLKRLGFCLACTWQRNFWWTDRRVGPNRARHLFAHFLRGSTERKADCRPQHQDRRELRPTPCPAANLPKFRCLIRILKENLIRDKLEVRGLCEPNKCRPKVNQGYCTFRKSNIAPWCDEHVIDYNYKLADVCNACFYAGSGGNYGERGD